MDEFILEIDNYITDDFCDIISKELRGHTNDYMLEEAVNKIGIKSVKKYLKHVETILSEKINDIYWENFIKVTTFGRGADLNHYHVTLHSNHIYNNNMNNSQIMMYCIYFLDTCNDETYLKFMNGKTVKCEKGKMLMFPSNWTYSFSVTEDVSIYEIIVLKSMFDILS